MAETISSHEFGTGVMDDSGIAEGQLAWIMLETNRETFKHQLLVKYWPGPEEGHLLAEAPAHGAWGQWLAG